MLPIMKKIQGICIDALEAQLIVMLNTADDRLFDMAENSYNNAQFDAMRLLRVKREGLICRFRQEISNNFRNLLSRPENEPNKSENVEHLSLDNISLVKNDDLEEKIAIDTMVKKTEVANHLALEHIQQRFNQLIDDKIIASDDNPIAPLQVCQAFKNASKTLDLDIASLLVIYKLFDRSVMQNMQQVYLKLNQFFVQHSVLPQLNDNPLSSSNTSSPSLNGGSLNLAIPSTQDMVDQLAINRTEQVNVSQSAHSAEANIDTGQNEVLNEIHRLLANSRPAASNVSIPQDPILQRSTSNHPTQLNTQQLVEILSQLQANHSTSQQKVIPAGEIKQSLTVAVPQLEVQDLSGSIGALNEDMIDIVSMLFDFILEDASIQPEVKSVIGRLQIPMLKVGLVDPKFISNRRHPARLLLNELAHAGLSCDMNDVASKPMVDKIEQVTDKIIQDFDNDMTLFEQLLEDFNGFKSKFLQKTNIFEKRIKEAEEGKAKAETARAEVNRCLTQLCAKKHLPDVVKSILKNIWSHVMLLEKLKGHQKGWASRVKVAKLLVWSVQPFETADRLDKLVSKVPLLVKSINTGAELISFSPIEVTHLLEQLEDEHRNIIESTKQAINDNKNEELLRLPAIDLDHPSGAEFASEKADLSFELGESQLKQTLSEEIVIEDIGFTAVQTGEIFRQEPVEPIPIDNKAMQIIEQLRAGSWIELKVDGEFKRCKLAARIASTGKYIFVNRSGMKMAEMLTIELCQAYQKGDMKILDDDALFDRALESVISNLRSMKA
ncbi:MAG: DUF1631 domain-containing protein [Enterobacterales bacterium]|nr:DUF1631 domain-containing protein [Enterobacterales bacterium]